MKSLVRITAFSALVLAGTVVLDRALFDQALFAVDNPSGWDSYRWINFEYHFRRAERAAAADRRPLVLFVGSSVAQYSYGRQALEAKLGPGYRVDLISHAAMLPSDLLHYRERLLRMRPAAIVWPVNTVDFDLERLTLPWEAGPLRSRKAEEEFLAIRAPAAMYYPLAASRSAPRISARAQLLLKSAFHSLRWRRDEWMPFVAFASDWRDPGGLRSYLNYQGSPVEGGLFREGHTGRCFSFPAAYLQGRQLVFEVPADLYASGLTLTVSPRRCGESGIVMRPRKAGWNTLELPALERYSITLSHVLKDGRAQEAAGLSNYEGRGLRLPGNFGRSEPPEDDLYVRHPILEEVRLQSLPEADLIRDYEKRLQPDGWEKRPELVSLNSLRLAKSLTLWNGFVMNRQLSDLREFVQRTSAETYVLVINQGEHPLALDDYAFGPWYSDYLGFLSSLSSDRVRVLDVHDRFSMRELGDPHHLTMDAADRLQTVIYESLRPVLGL